MSDKKYSREELDHIAKQAARFRDLYRQADEAAAPVLAESDRLLEEHLNTEEKPRSAEDFARMAALASESDEGFAKKNTPAQYEAMRYEEEFGDLWEETLRETDPDKH